MELRKYVHRMLNPKVQQQQRAFALEVLAAVSDCPSINREELFAASMEFCGWQLMNTNSPEDLKVYAREFAIHHAALVNCLGEDLQEAAFITWFVENDFHRQPLVPWYEREDEHAMALPHFSLPSFRLPLGMYRVGYLTQWLLWYVGQVWYRDPKGRAEEPDSATLYRWSRDLVNSLPVSCELDRVSLMEQCGKFFAWCWANADAWTAIELARQEFLRQNPDLDDESEDNEWDAHFITWFVGHDFAVRAWLDKEAS